ncbi:MAG: virulence RhuM family protein [Firmicutes bacterium]|nr:virulence RhuM family protein [Bacillota bacterium]
MSVEVLELQDGDTSFSKAGRILIILSAFLYGKIKNGKADTIIAKNYLGDEVKKLNFFLNLPIFNL